MVDGHPGFDDVVPADVEKTRFQLDFEKEKERTQRIRDATAQRLQEAKSSLPLKVEQYIQRKGHPPDSEAMFRMQARTISLTKYLSALEDQLRLLRPTTDGDISYRNRVRGEFPNLIRDHCPQQIPFRFHGTPLYYAEDIVDDKKIASSVDRLGIETSYDAADQVSVTTSSTIETTIDSYTDISANLYCLPTGCVFVLLPATRMDEEAGQSMLMGNVDFIKQPKQFYKILCAVESLDLVRSWLSKSGQDPQKAVDFFSFIDELDQLKDEINSGELDPKVLLPY